MSPAQVSKVRVNSDAIKAILNSAETERDLVRRAKRVEAALPTSKGEEWETVTLRGDRVSVMVRAKNTEARRAAAEDLALQTAIGAARDA